MNDKPSSSSTAIATHYNSVPNTNVQERTKSEIYYLRNFNNWMKSCLISDYLGRLKKDGCQSATVLDLCCGKGGDLLKWKIGGIKEIVMADVAGQALNHCKDRYARLTGPSRRPPFIAHFIELDASESVLAEYLPYQDMKFDICSCQFALHYAFRSERHVRRMLQNATAYLRPGGYFIGTIPNADMIVKMLRHSNGSFKNEVCNIEYRNNGNGITETSSPPPLFGAELNFHLGEVVDCPEYLAYFPLLIKMLERLDMELIYQYTFPDAMKYYLENNNEAKDLLVRMDALATINNYTKTENITGYEHVMEQAADGQINFPMGTLSKSEWEVASLYLVFGFRKKLH